MGFKGTAGGGGGDFFSAPPPPPPWIGLSAAVGFGGAGAALAGAMDVHMVIDATQMNGRDRVRRSPSSPMSPRTSGAVRAKPRGDE